MSRLVLFPRRLFRRHTRNFFRRFLDRAEIFLYPAVELVRLEIAHHDEGRVVRPVKGRMKGAHFRQLRGIELGDVADSRPFVGMNGKGFPIDVEIEFAVRIGQDSLPVFLLHHVALGGEILFVERERRHSFRFRPRIGSR